MGRMGHFKRRCERLRYVRRGVAHELLILTLGNLISSCFNLRRVSLVECPPPTLSDAIAIDLALSITLDITQLNSLAFMSSCPGISTWCIRSRCTCFNSVSNLIQRCFSGPPKQGTAKKGDCRQCRPLVATYHSPPPSQVQCAKAWGRGTWKYLHYRVTIDLEYNVCTYCMYNYTSPLKPGNQV